MYQSTAQGKIKNKLQVHTRAITTTAQEFRLTINLNPTTTGQNHYYVYEMCFEKKILF